MPFEGGRDSERWKKIGREDGGRRAEREIDGYCRRMDILLVH
jgi:hypothetical protein